MTGCSSDAGFIVKGVIDYRTAIIANGFALIPDFIASDQLERVALAISHVDEESCIRNRGVYAIRNLLQGLPSVAS